MLETCTQKKEYGDTRRMGLKVDPFQLTLSNHGLTLKREKTKTLQVNVGLLCNQNCQHCHLNSGPSKKENMDADTLNEVVAYPDRKS